MGTARCATDACPTELTTDLAVLIPVIEALCECGHRGTVDADRWPEKLEVPMIKHLVRCSKCGQRPRQTIPTWPARRGLLD